MKIIFPKDYVRQPLPGKAVWTKALRSGEYKKGQGYLAARSKEGDKRYCCLGVLSKIQGRLEGENDNLSFDLKESYTSGLCYNNPLYEYFGDGGNFPKGVYVEDYNSLDMLGFTLIAINDYDRNTFHDVANVIDAVWYDPEFETPYSYTTLIN